MEQLHNKYIEHLLNCNKPKNILEIGVLEGKHTLRLLQWCKSNDSFLVSVDPCRWRGNLPDEIMPGATGYLYRRGTVKEKNFIEPIYIEEALEQGLDRYWLCVKSFSLDFLKENTRTFDFVFIDGDHNYYTVYNELSYASKALNKTGLIFIHDIANCSCARKDFYYDRTHIPKKYVNGSRQGILTAIEDFVLRNSNFKFEILTMDQNGLGVVSGVKK